MGMMGWISAGLKRLRRAQGGAAAVEFALVLPVMLAVYIGAMEASTLITVDRKVQSVAGAVGDLVARSDQSVSASDLQDYFRAASVIMTPYSSSQVVQVVTAVRVDTAGVPRVVWTRKFQNGAYSATTPHTVGQPFALPREMLAVVRNGSDRMVIAAEASYSYTPLYGIFIDAVNLHRSSFFLPRFSGSIGVGS